ncbi:hypothetical protein FACI_IFERC00001G1686 [Ferroplasma acidarmanus Fer1]|uniref:Uncharacterized protein n=2 Tax=Ferroplasma TaxID=74968 RepID=S0ARQ5_FERAC|nr:hypothetical protein FACI_IFERC00001G1686 [Ferroplasma acidarmanus Fer1]
MSLSDKPKLKFSLIPIIILIAMIFIPLPFHFFFRFNYIYYMPVLFFIAGFFVIFVGAWYDFGAKKYVTSLFQSRQHIEDSDFNDIYKQQLIMTLIFIGIGILYMIVGYVIFVI